ncbi:MAG: tRNA (adenosine(37)-N6)-threonylcarbamoyltransferase complex dimerization subunit type 1 TsaB [Treponema sp.]|jgi:tRNA threonylcarbamoyladenosine biosynthesis protein TsaB|nr:tRNA (adenosine(37)-N6)-threonylcarbamoyltransferase complex dimerization subunit type 1 TsaB [Treponema sp.]
MIILALDTATALLSVALSVGHDPAETWYVEIDAGQRHSELLMDLIDSLLKTANIVPTDVDALASMKGPGSFTGLRIGFSTAQGIALALGVPSLSIPTLDCMAVPHQHWSGIVVPAIDAKKRCFFSALYRGVCDAHTAGRLTDYMDADSVAIAQALNAVTRDEPVLLTGPDAELLASALNETPLFNKTLLRLDPIRRRGHAKELATLAQAKLAASSAADIAAELSSGLLYLRRSDAELRQP